MDTFLVLSIFEWPLQTGFTTDFFQFFVLVDGYFIKALDFIMSSKSDCSIRVHSVCLIGYQSTSVDDKPDNFVMEANTMNEP